MKKEGKFNRINGSIRSDKNNINANKRVGNNKYKQEENIEENSIKENKFSRINGSIKNKNKNKNTNRENYNNKHMNSRDNDIITEEVNLQLEGRNSVLEALNSNRTIDKIIFKKGEVEGTLKIIRGKALDKGIVVQETDKRNLDSMAQTHNHQGVIAICPAHEYAEVDDILELAKEKNEDPFILILDGITDTYNLGAIIRTADIAGVHGIIIPKRRSAGLTSMVSKISAGAIEYVKVAKVINISRTIEELKSKGIWVGSTVSTGQSMYNNNLKGPLAIVIGNEGDGVSKLVKEKSDFTLSIPMYGNLDSLNASVAAGVIIYEALRQRKQNSI